MGRYVHQEKPVIPSEDGVNVDTKKSGGDVKKQGGGLFVFEEAGQTDDSPVFASLSLVAVNMVALIGFSFL